MLRFGLEMLDTASDTNHHKLFMVLVDALAELMATQASHCAVDALNH